ncbi:hypothetical protein QR680_007991 [Steinernema hermaphroditum]|uniref:Carbonyl reductase n=1 Tax=Steinernema hermaphroditum TaxID=289476 RepID=A0AA39IGC8_9BILA|nr:hypothetical protein QR680_007991 [Steinernema hermaphroditum]
MAARVFVVTGGNRGIGYAIVKGLAEKETNAVVYLTARKSSEGEEAVQKIKEELGAKLKSDVRAVAVDITDAATGKKLAEYLKAEHGGLDVLINNAGFAFKNDATESPFHQAEVTIGINYYGTKLISSFLTPLIRTNGRVVNVCSQAGVMKGGMMMTVKYSDENIAKLHDPNVTEQTIDDFVEKYKVLAQENRRKEGGYPESAYCVSKAAEIALTMMQARELKAKGIKVNACCPGYVSTGMTSYKGQLTVEEGADTPIFLATDPNAPDGKFVYQRKEISW